MSYEITSCRWRDYFLRGGNDFTLFWEDFLSEKRDLLFLLGHGFDARMCECSESILSIGREGVRDALLIEYDEGAESSSHKYRAQREANGVRLEALFAERGALSKRNIRMLSEDGRRIGARSIANEFPTINEFLRYSDVIVDISALPRGLYFPLLSKLLALFDQGLNGTPPPNLHVVVSHSAEHDDQIVDEGVDEAAGFLHGFAAASFELEATRDQPRIWIPLLGKGQRLQLERVYELVQPDEICPLLPSPAHDPRDADNLVLEYRDLLFDQLRVEPQNFIYAAETNPFEVYRQIVRSILHYKKALGPLGGCKAVVSAMSSKLLSLGAILAAYELSQWRQGADRVDVGVGHVDTQGYRVLGTVPSEAKSEYYTMWLSGECYAQTK